MSRYLWDRIAPVEVEILRKFTQFSPVRVGELAEALGIKVVKAPLPPKISGLIRPAADARSGYEIKVNKYESPERQRFTIAHEISHFLLHKADIRNGVIDSIMYRSNLTSRKEVEANKLAADIVMPDEIISRELIRLGGRSAPGIVEDMASVFRVSVPAMKVRLGLA